MIRHARAAGAATLATALVATLLAFLGAAVVPAQALVDKDCGDFATQAKAQEFFLANDPANDPHKLDADGDKIACETLPCPCSSSTTPTGGSTTTVLRQRGRIDRVVDGDTVDVRLASGATKRVRMIGIDTPERGRCGYVKATRTLRRMGPVGTRVTLVSDPTQDLRDRYGRLLRYVVRRSDAKDLNRAQVAKGMAKVYVYDNTPFRRTASYRRAQRAASANDRGLWNGCW